MNHNVIFSQSLEADLQRLLAEHSPDRLFLLADTGSQRHCLPLVEQFDCLRNVECITIGNGDEHKTLDSLSAVWAALQQGGATRHSLLLNLGGGMVTDLGGFAASTFKRGMAFVNIPTTLLSMVDASVGGKTGINFGGLKNEVGVFSNARSVLIDTRFLSTLDAPNIRSGYAEMLKHALISDTRHWAELLQFDLFRPDFSLLQELVQKSVAIKESIVQQDPTEKGLRKALNLGHTAGHAFESLALEKGLPVLHGYAVAWGLVCELYLSVRGAGFPKQKLQQTLNFVRETYGTFVFDCTDYETLYAFMTHDKKNEGTGVNFTLLAEVGNIRINQIAAKEEIFDMLDFYRDCMGA